MVLLSQFTIESVFAHSTTIELPHDKAVFLNEIKDGLIFVRNTLEPFMLVNVALDNLDLRIQDIMEMFAFVEHGATASEFMKSIAFLDAYGNRLCAQDKRLYKIHASLALFCAVASAYTVIHADRLNMRFIGFHEVRLEEVFLGGGLALAVIEACRRMFSCVPVRARAILGLIVGFLVFFWSYHQNRVSHPQGPVLTP